MKTKSINNFIFYFVVLIFINFYSFSSNELPMCGPTTPEKISPMKDYELNETPHAHGVRYTINDEPVRRGDVAERFEVRDGDCGGRDCGAPRYRSEIGLKCNKTQDRIGEDIWYGWSFYNESIPKFKDEVNLMPTIGQWKMHGNAAPMIKIYYQGYKKTFEVQLTDLSFSNNWGKEEDYGDICTLFSHFASKKRWVDIVMNTNFSADSDGYLKIWVNNELRCDYQGPILVDTNKRQFPGPNHRRGIFVSYTKRWDSVQPDLEKPTMIAYYDEFLIGKSREEVDTKFREDNNLPAKD